MATNGPASFYEISSLTRKSRVDTNLLPTAATSTWGISSYVGPLQLHVIRIHCGPEIMNVRNSVSPIFERILKRKQNTLRISVQKTRFCFTNTWTKERLFIRTPWRQRLWENWRYSSIHLQSWLRAANGQFYVPAVVPTEYEAAWTARPVWTLRWTLLSLPRNERRFIGRPARIVVTIPNTLYQVQKLNEFCTCWICAVGRAERRKTVWPHKSRGFSYDKGALPLIS